MKRIATLFTLAALLGACSYGPLYRGPVAPLDARLRRLGPVEGTGTGYNAGISTGRANEEVWTKAKACGAEQIVDAYEEASCLEGIRWILFFLPTCSSSVHAIAVSYRPAPTPEQFQRCIQRIDSDGADGEVASQ
jgi:hypothetical protein